MENIKHFQANSPKNILILHDFGNFFKFIYLLILFYLFIFNSSYAKSGLVGPTEQDFSFFFFFVNYMYKCNINIQAKLQPTVTSLLQIQNITPWH